MADTFLQTYLSELQIIRASGTGVKETSYYPAVSSLFNAVGKTLKPNVRCIINLKNTGAGIPDGGFFTPDQFSKSGEATFGPGQMPSRGVLEVKGTAEAVRKIADGEQVEKYRQKYGQVLVTNLRDFLLVGRDENGQKVTLETFALAPGEAEFWALASSGKVSALLEEQFAEYLKRVLLSAAPLAAPEDVAWFLASYARDAKNRIELAGLPALASVRTALEDALGLKFDGIKGEHFFRSTLVQTLFYGVFSAWVLWCRQQNAAAGGPKTSQRFEWKMAAWELHVPMIRALFQEVAKPSQLGPLGLVEVLDWTGAALNRVDQAAFFAKFDQAHAVQYFYEPFLSAFDPELRKDLGVWYTPPEIVRYMVARVDAVLREELGIPDGLADPNVYVLDPCCGTGAYLVEVLHLIEARLAANGGDALRAADLKTAATTRIFGFEILPAPFVVAHLQLSLLLQNAGAPLADTERAGVYLTNALTGWEPPKEPKTHLLFPELEAERDAADQVKQQKPILVILGNPPYNSFAGAAVDEERALSMAYRTTKHAPAPQGQGLNDLYIRFFRAAERRITEGTGKGIVCFISNYSWLDGLSHTGMRERYLEAFDDIWIDSLNGDKYKTGKVTPAGLPDPSVFSTEFNREGIQVGTAVALFVRKAAHQAASVVHFRHWWGKEKRAELLASLNSSVSGYAQFVPSNHTGLTFAPLEFRAEYHSWPLLPDLFPVSFPGVKTSRDDVVVDIDRARLEKRMTQYFDLAVSHEQMKRIAPGAMEEGNRFNAVAVRETLQKRGFLPQNIVRYFYRPFDFRWLYWEPETKLLDEKRTDYFPQVFPGNIWIEARQKQPMEKFDRGFSVRSLADNLGNGLSSYFPLLLKPKPQAGLLDLETEAAGPRPNLSERAQAYLGRLGEEMPGVPPAPNNGGVGEAGEAFLSPPVPPLLGARGTPETSASLLFYHTLATLHAPAYRNENGGALRQDWPRIPLPETRDALLASAALGRQIAALLDTETLVVGVTAGTLRPEIARLGVIQRTDGGQLRPESGDLTVSAGWGHAGKEGVTMPGKGKSVGRDYTAAERAALTAGAAALGLTEAQVIACLGPATRDVYLNGVAYWQNVPAQVWDYTIGGYQVIKKWLSYREAPLLNRTLTRDEAREVTAMVRRLAALRLLEPTLDANYQSAQASAFAWNPPYPHSDAAAPAENEALTSTETE